MRSRHGKWINVIKAWESVVVVINVVESPDQPHSLNGQLQVGVQCAIGVDCAPELLVLGLQLLVQKGTEGIVEELQSLLQSLTGPEHSTVAGLHGYRRL
jgi:hypothetical protein